MSLLHLYVNINLSLSIFDTLMLFLSRVSIYCLISIIFTLICSFFCHCSLKKNLWILFVGNFYQLHLTLTNYSTEWDMFIRKRKAIAQGAFQKLKEALRDRPLLRKKRLRNCCVKSFLIYIWTISRQMISRLKETNVATLKMLKRPWKKCVNNGVTFGNMIMKK